MDITPIRCEADYDAALGAIDSLIGAAPGTPEGGRLKVLVTLVEAYEARRWPVEAPDPVSMIEHVMEARGYRQKDLAAVIGSQPHASEVLSRRRPLTLPMIRALSELGFRPIWYQLNRRIAAHLLIAPCWPTTPCI